MSPASGSVPANSMEEIAIAAGTDDKEDTECPPNEELNTDETLDPKQLEEEQLEDQLEDNGLQTEAPDIIGEHSVETDEVPRVINETNI